MKAFASDNYSGIHPEILEAISDANLSHAVSYGDDAITARANALFEHLFGPVKTLYTFNGTGANVVALKCAALPFQSVICTQFAHIHVDECGAPVQAIGCTLLPLPSPDGKLTPAMVQPLLSAKGNVHHNQPKVISISQSTELGTVYTLDEVRALCDFAHANDMYVHLDGARIANAVAALGTGLKEATVDCGVDIMSFGGTKNGLMIGEAVLIFNNELKQHADYYHKQSAQLFSKNRFIAAQFVALLSNELWKRMALHANAMAQLLASEVSKIEGVTVTRPTDANGVFAIIPPEAIEPLQKQFRFYVWDESTLELRWMCSFDTTEEEVYGFVAVLKQLIAGLGNV
ncbi:MAG: low specificity L-threonine aldolase [Bacteroidales bacterium]|nr:low specificity L-threonine aldolase [Bacteroidales bacterium]